MPYTACQDESDVWTVCHDGVEIPALRFYDRPEVARDMATVLNWAEQDRIRYGHLTSDRK